MRVTLLLAALATWCPACEKPAGKGEDATQPTTYEVWAHFRDGSGLPTGARVVVDDLPVGEIKERVLDGKHVRVIMRIRRDVALWSRAVAHKKSTSLLGDYYIELDPGSEGTGSRLEHGDQVLQVVEAASPGEIMRRAPP